MADDPYISSLNAQTDEPTICKFSTTSSLFDSMDGKFDGVDTETFSTINTKSMQLTLTGDYSYNVVCRNKAGLDSDNYKIQS